MSIATVEQFFIDRVKARFGARLKGVESLPSDWDSKTVDRMLVLAPGVFVVFAGGPAIPGTNEINGRWILVGVTSHASGEKARRHGDAREIGAYEIVETAVPLFSQVTIPDVSTIEFVDVANLFDAVDESRGLSIYGAAFNVRMSLDAPEPGTPDPLDAFLTFHAEHDLAEPDGTSEAADTVTLPQ